VAQQLVEGWTERVRTKLLVDGAALDLTAYAGDDPPASIVMELYGRNGRQVEYEGTAGVEEGSAEEGIVYFDPDEDDLKASLSPYKVRWKVTDSFGKVVFFPNGDPEVWTVSSVSGA
jgi:hypothetical protein